MRTAIFLALWPVACVGWQATGAFGQEDGAQAGRPLRESSSANDFDRRLDSFRIVDEIDTARQPPVHEYPEGASQVATVLGRQARTLPLGDGPKVMAWMIGRGRGLQAGRAYVLEIEYPDDVPRTVFLANRGGDVVRGFATGSALGDARQQYVQPSVESLQYPQSGQWQRYRTLFFLNDRFQGLYADRDPKPGGRPFTPGDGFHVLAFQTKRINDPRSAGVALGRIRLREVPDIASLYAEIEFPPPELPRRRVFFREEMADQVVSAAAAKDRGVVDPVDWLLHKAKLSRMLGINTFAKDLLEFGFNQGWTSGDENWVMNATPPLKDLWDRTVPRIAAEGLDLLPYYGYSLAFRETIPRQSWRAEQFHSAPNADPENYRDNRHVMLTFPVGRLCTVARADLMDRYRTASGLTVVRHYTLNEDNHDRTKGTSNLPFDGQVGYVCVDVDRAGPHVRLLEARAVAHGDPRNLGYLCASAFSTGFPEYVRRFNQAFLAVPALPSTIVHEAADDAEVVVREIGTHGHGAYYYVVNTSMRQRRGVTVRLPASGTVRDLVEHRQLPGTTLRLDLYPGELRSYRVDEK